MCGLHRAINLDTRLIESVKFRGTFLWDFYVCDCENL
jgi:hypothetical protein